MVYIHSVSGVFPETFIDQSSIREFANSLFYNSGLNVNKLLPIFENAKIQRRPILKSVDWYAKTKTFKEKNDEFLKHSLELGEKACRSALEKANLEAKDVAGFLVVTSSGFVTPTLDARLMDILGMDSDCIRVPITGLGCAGGVYGLSRAKDLANLNPGKKILLLAVETCTITFRPSDKRKANLVALSLFSDGAAAVVLSTEKKEKSIFLKDSYSYKWKDSLSIMGWDVEEDGLQVVFDKSIPVHIHENYAPIFQKFLEKYSLNRSEIKHFVFHPGGKKVLDAFAASLNEPEESFKNSFSILENYGNLSSPTVLLVLEKFLEEKNFHGNELGVLSAMGPGFTSEFLSFETSM